MTITPELRVQLMDMHKKENEGRSKVRNRGVQESESEIIIFMDDDMRFTSEVVEQHLRHHQSYANSILAGIPIEDPTKIKNDIQSYKRHLSLNWIEKFDQGLNKLDKKVFLGILSFSENRNTYIYSSDEEIKCFDFYYINCYDTSKTYINGKFII